MPPVSAHDAPVAATEFAAAVEGILPEGPFALAVSGGADSLSLMRLAAEWCRSRNRPPPLAVTVDHGLRPAAAGEAAQVARWAHDAGLPHRVLRWEPPRPCTNLHATAREARYRLIGETMRDNGIAALATGHTADDQAETVLMRLARGSGLAGLSGMRPVAPFPLHAFADLRLCRPLLAFAHRRLEATLRAHGQPWIEDPANADPRFLRAQIRQLMPKLAEAGLTSGRLVATADHLARANAVVHERVLALQAQAIEVFPTGYVLLRSAPMVGCHDELALRLLARVLKGVAGSDYPPELGHLQAALDWLRAPGGPRGRTLGGCRLVRRREGAVLVVREQAAMGEGGASLALQPGRPTVWDGRFRIAVPQGALGPEVEVRALGLEGVATLGDRLRLPAHEPRRVAAASPGIWQGGRLVSAPSLGHPGACEATATFLGL